MILKEGTYLQGGNYKIVRHIASGGFGNTYEGYDVNLNKKVAIKEFFVKDFCTRDTDMTSVTVTVPAKRQLILHLKQKFIEEARAIANMEHENIVRVQTLFEENGTAYYVMDYIEGESLSNLIKRRGSLSEEEALPIIQKVADALGYMHKKNCFHLDVKPSNIMLRNDGKVILIDFGSAKQYAEVDGENTTTLAPCYTPGYAPSEQMNPRPTKFTAATDIYALGATLYKMLTGMTPPSAIDLQNEEATLSSLPECISAPTRSAVEKALIPQKKSRTQTVAAFLEHMNGGTYTAHVQQNGENGGNPDHSLPPTDGNNRNHFIKILLFVIIAIIVGGGLYFSIRSAGTPNNETIAAVRDTTSMDSVPATKEEQDEIHNDKEPTEELTENQRTWDKAADTLGVVVEDSPIKFNYTKYHNSRFNYSVSFPNNLKVYKNSSNGDGRVFLSPDGTAIFTVYGYWNNACMNDGTLGNDYNDAVADYGNSVTYKTLKPNFFVISGVRADKIYYHITKWKGDIGVTAIFEYNQSDKQSYNKACGKILNSLTL